MPCTTAFDDRLGAIRHFQLYPDMYPWVGTGYAISREKIVLVGESHYLGERSTCHLDAASWYEGVTTLSEGAKNAIRTRTTLGNAIRNNWKAKSSLIYKNIDVSLRACGVGEQSGVTPFAGVAFMNYFQRPAKKGRSLEATQLDKTISFDVFCSVLDVLTPDTVVFCSKLAWRAAHAGEIVRYAADRHIRCVSTVHPATRWWHTPMRKYGNKSGKQMFEEALQVAPAASLVPLSPKPAHSSAR